MLLWGGCLSVEGQWVETMGPGKNPSGNIQFQDVPVPLGMNLRSSMNESYSHEVGAFRTGHFVYDGAVAIDQIEEYLLERMPLHGWQLEAHERPNEDVRRLKFRHLDQTVSCEIARRAGGSMLVIDLNTRRQRS